jgi:hypothetical protein
MGQLVLWALATGFVAGAAWFGILFFRRNAAPAAEPPTLPPTPAGDPAQLHEVRHRLLELEERLDATEYQIKRDRERQLGKPRI